MSIAYFSSVKFAPSKLFWLVTGLHNVDAKILTLFGIALSISCKYF
jgi:hypothetical protein